MIIIKWTTAYINDLPDACFAYIEPGGSKDQEGKTVPRSLRHLPYKDKDGKIDIPHLRNALTRLPQTGIPPGAKREALKKLIAAAREAGVDVDEERYKKEYNLADQGLLKIPFFRLGVWRHPQYGVIRGDRQLFSSIMKNFRDGVLGRPVFVRLGHDRGNTFGGAPAEAWVKDIVEDDGVLTALAEPTDPAILEQVRAGRYRFASAEYDPDYVDKETGKRHGPVLTAIALTNEPFLTRLPPARVLADPPETIYLDYAEVESDVENELLKENNNLLRRLTDVITNFFSGNQPGDEKPGRKPDGGNGGDSKPDPALEDLKRRLADAEARVKAAEERERVAACERKLADLVAKGIPPAMCDKAKAIILAAPVDATVKLADGATKSLADLVYDLLESLPSDARVKLGQHGAQESVKPGATAADIYGDVVPGLKKEAK
ncbi:MAG: hypothetical protein QME76_12470 [Bacillota bacterium]|nr:hypothetical protein [Bacillota bacterium]